MKTFRTVQVEQKELDSVICNMCGRIIGKNPHGYWHEHLGIDKAWGYGSLWDGETHSFDICMDCYQNWTNAFSVKISRSPEDTEED